MKPIADIIEQVNYEADTGQLEEDYVPPYDLSKWAIDRFNGEPEPMQFLVDSLIPQGITGTIYSAGGSGKSTLALDLSIRISIAQKFETKWLGKFPVRTGGMVLYFSAEEPDKELHKRIRGLAEAIAVELDIDIENLLKICQENLFIINVWGTAKLLFDVNSNAITLTEEYKRIYSTLQCRGIKLVIFDTRSRLSGAEGSGNAIVSQEVAHYEKLAADFDTTVLILHHTNKASYGNESHSAAAQRGESAFLDCLRFGLYIQVLSDKLAEKYGIPKSDCSNYLIVNHSKNNYTEKQEPFILHRVGWKFELTNLKSGATTEERKAQQEASHIAMAVDIVKQNPDIIQTKLTKLLQESGISYKHAREAFQNAVAIGELKEVRCKQGVKKYSVPYP